MKERVDDLALFGGPREFEAPRHVGRPHVPDPEAVMRRVAEMLERRWLTNHGPLVEEFEQRVASFVGAAHCVATCNGTSALQIAALSSGMSGEVIVPGFSFVATAHALAWVGMTPVLCDVDRTTHNIDPAAVERLAGPRTRGVVPVHLWGRPADVERLTDLCAERGLPLVFDAAHAFGCTHGGRMVGSFGNAEVLSFHATKVVSAMEGGAVVTNDDSLAERARLLRNFGFADYDQVVELGTNAKMSEMAAAVGLSSLEHIDDVVALNRGNAERYAERLAPHAGITPLHRDPAERHNHQQIVVEVDADSTGIHRDVLQRVLWHENVLARRYFHPGIHRMEPYAHREPPAELPATDALAGRTLSLPSGGELTGADVDRICELLAFALAHGEEITARCA